MPSKSKGGKSLTKSQVIAEIATKVGLTKTQVSGFFDALTSLVESELKTGHPIVIPGLVKITLVNKAATAARPGRNPSTGETITIKAKPARKVVKVRVLKQLKEVV